MIMSLSRKDPEREGSRQGGKSAKAPHELIKQNSDKFLTGSSENYANERKEKLV